MGRFRFRPSSWPLFVALLGGCGGGGEGDMGDASVRPVEDVSVVDEEIGELDASADIAQERPRDPSEVGSSDAEREADTDARESAATRDASDSSMPREASASGDGGTEAGILPVEDGAADATADNAAADGASTEAALPEGGDSSADAAGAPSPTKAIFAAISPTCLRCATENGCFIASDGETGGLCEDVPGELLRVPGMTEAAECQLVLQKIFSSNCAASKQLTPCLCGTTDPKACLAGTMPASGPLYNDYADDYGTTDVSFISKNFSVSAFGAGMANGIVGCAAAYGCDDCFVAATASGDGGGN